MALSRGEVWWYERPDHEARPYLILTRDQAIPVLNRILAVPATTAIRGIPTEVPLDRSDGMPEACCLTLDNVAGIRPSLCTERITRLSPAKMREVCRALTRATGCDLD